MFCFHICIKNMSDIHFYLLLVYIITIDYASTMIFLVNSLNLHELSPIDISQIPIGM